MAEEKKFEIEAEVKARFTRVIMARSFEDAMAQAQKMKARDFARPLGAWYSDDAVINLKSVEKLSR